MPLLPWVLRIDWGGGDLGRQGDMRVRLSKKTIKNYDKLNIPPCSMKSTGLITVDREEGGRHKIRLIV